MTMKLSWKYGFSEEYRSCFGLEMAYDLSVEWLQVAAAGGCEWLRGRVPGSQASRIENRESSGRKSQRR